MADVVVVGAGPTGCAAAIALAQNGAEVILAEAKPKAAERFAGEWMHPPGVRQLDKLGIDTGRLTRASGSGFVLMAPQEEPVQLPYARGYSLARIHHDLVFDLRQLAESHPKITYRPNCAFRGFEGEHVVLEHNGQKELHTYQRVVGADGRNSKVRQALNAPLSAFPISYMMGVEMKGVKLPFEGLGHVIAGGPGPALLYRVNSDTVRGCLDVPVELGGDARKKEAIYKGFAKVLPKSLLTAFESALAQASPWAATRFAPRTFFGRDRVWLAGDAVGHLHPITGMGMTLGMLDATALAACNTLVEYEERRSSYVVELLTNVLYHVLRREDESARRVRHGLLAMLRNNPNQRLRTMRILTGEDENPTSFVLAFLKTAAITLSKSLPLHPSHVGTDLNWLKWPMSAALSPVLGPKTLRAQCSFASPFEDPKALLQNKWVDQLPSTLLNRVPAPLRGSASA